MSCDNWQNLPHAPPVLCSICTYNNVMVWPSSPPPVHHLTSTDRPNNSPTQGESWVNRSCISSTKTPLELWCVLYLKIMGVEVSEAIIARHITHYTIHMCIDLKKKIWIITDKIKYVQRKCHKIFFPQLLSHAMNVGVAKNSMFSLLHDTLGRYDEWVDWITAVSEVHHHHQCFTPVNNVSQYNCHNKRHSCNPVTGSSTFTQWHTQT